MRKSAVQKSYEISDAKISFVSLVDKAANKKQFLITKAEDGKANFTTYGRILKVDADNHYVTGIVYEPMVEDSHGNFMTEEEIQKSAYWFAKNGDKVDIQHSFEELAEAAVVENWVTKSETTIEGETITKGTWLMTVEITNSDVWDQIQKGELTGFSMGGVGKYSTEDVDLENIEKGDKPMSGDGKEKLTLVQKIAKAMGFEVVAKGEFLDSYNSKKKSSLFWNAWYTLEELLCRWDWYDDKYKFESDEEKIREALSEFTTIVTDILTLESVTKSLALDKNSDVIKKAEPVIKAGKKMSAKNKETLDSIVDAISKFKAEFETNNEEEEESEVKKEDFDQIEKMVTDVVTKALGKEAPAPAPAASPVVKAEEKSVEITADAIQKMVEAAVAKALGEEPEQKEVEKSDALTADAVQEMITKALAPVLKARGLSSNLNDEDVITKSEEHYLHGIL